MLDGRTIRFPISTDGFSPRCLTSCGLPFNAVPGGTRVLRATQVEAPTRTRALERIERNARAPAWMIEDRLDISRIVTGKLRLQIQDVDLAAIIDAAIEAAGYQAHVAKPFEPAGVAVLVAKLARRGAPRVSTGSAVRSA